MTAGWKVVLLLAMVLPAAAWRAFVACVLWGWFVTPTFGIPAPGLWMMAGVLMLASLVTAKRSGEDDTEGQLLFVIMYPAVVLLFGWLIHLLAG